MHEITPPPLPLKSFGSLSKRGGKKQFAPPPARGGGSNRKIYTPGEKGRILREKD